MEKTRLQILNLTRKCRKMRTQHNYALYDVKKCRFIWSTDEEISLDTQDALEHEFKTNDLKQNYYNYYNVWPNNKILIEQELAYQVWHQFDRNDGHTIRNLFLVFRYLGDKLQPMTDLDLQFLNSYLSFDIEDLARPIQSETIKLMPQKIAKCLINNTNNKPIIVSERYVLFYLDKKLVFKPLPEDIDYYEFVKQMPNARHISLPNENLLDILCYLFSKNNANIVKVNMLDDFSRKEVDKLVANMQNNWRNIVYLISYLNSDHMILDFTVKIGESSFTISVNGDLTISGNKFEISKVIAELTNLLNRKMVKSRKDLL